MNSWWFRMKPRSIIKTIEWFPSFASLEGEDWDLKTGNFCAKQKPIHFNRRKYNFIAHGEDIDINFDDYLCGIYDKSEVESAARNDKVSFEFFGFGYVDEKNLVKCTKIGYDITSNRMSSELLLKQLLKIQFPSPATKLEKNNSTYLFPLELILHIFNNFDELNKFEVGLLFGCMSLDKIDNTIKAIKEFRSEYNKLPNKLLTSDVLNIYTTIFKKYYPSIKNSPSTYYKDYGDALIRALQYTGLFAQRGRGDYSKLYIPKHSLTKIDMLRSKYSFIPNKEVNKSKYMEWFGDPYNIKLPWENTNERKILIADKVKEYKNILKSSKSIYSNLEALNISNIDRINELNDEKELANIEHLVTDKLLTLNEKIFIEVSSKTKSVRNEIIEKFYDILKGNEDMAALWLECNTWKSLVSLHGNHFVKRNFKIEDDLTPRSFAPGIGNTPDMELYLEDTIILPEVSLMTGVKQWEHEGSSVIDHVFKFIEKYPDKNVYGIFISSKIHTRTLWQFFILNKESWIGKKVPVIPFTIEQYIAIINHLYKNNLNILNFKNIIEEINFQALNCSSFNAWNIFIKDYINSL